MTGHIEKTVFISYRRTNVPWALAIYQELMHHGYDVFFDYQSIDSGNFEKVILENIKTRAHFLVILTPSALERCKEPGDWLRREIETAMDEKRNIVQLMLESFDFGSPLVKDALTGKLASLNQFNGLRVYSEYFFEAMDKLRERYLNVAISDIVLPSLNAEAKVITKTQKTAASEAPQVEKEELTAQEWFERGYVFGSNNDIDESIRCFTEAIHLNPSYEAYFNRGVLRRGIGDLDGAIQDYDHAIDINPKEAQTYNNRGNARRDKGDLDGAITDYNTAILLEPDAARVFVNRGIVHRIQENIDDALTDFNEALTLKTFPEDLAEASYNRGRLLQFKSQLDEAIKDYQGTLRIMPDHILARASLVDVLRKLRRNAEADEQEKVARQLSVQEFEYNQACFEGILGNIDEALRVLELGLKSKLTTKEWARQDPDLENLRDDPRFKELVGE